MGCSKTLSISPECVSYFRIYLRRGYRSAKLSSREKADDLENVERGKREGPSVRASHAKKERDKTAEDVCADALITYMVRTSAEALSPVLIAGTTLSEITVRNREGSQASANIERQLVRVENRHVSLPSLVLVTSLLTKSAAASRRTISSD